MEFAAVDVSPWETWARRGISAASMAASLGFYVARRGTQFGVSFFHHHPSQYPISHVAPQKFSVVRFGVGGSMSLVGTPGILLATAVTEGLNIVEKIALVPINVSQSLVSTSFVAASGSVDVLSNMFGTTEASFSLGEFVTLVRREWNSPLREEHLPKEKDKYSVLDVAKALIAWAGIQIATRGHHETRWKEAIEEITPERWSDTGNGSTTTATDSLAAPTTSKRDSRVFVTEDFILPEHAGQIISADIGEKTASATSPTDQIDDRFNEASDSSLPPLPPLGDVRLTLRRLSKLVLGGYGGAGLLFFGIPFPHKHKAHTSSPTDAENKAEEEEVLAQLVLDADEDEAAAATTPPAPHPHASPSWWNIVMGRHDQEIFEGFASSSDLAAAKLEKEFHAVVGQSERNMPRFWVLTDHGRKQIVLVFRGTMSLNELAVDLTCDSAEFEPNTDNKRLSTATDLRSYYLVHGGMLRMAEEMGGLGRPVHTAVGAALRRNRGYELLLCGHSLGAGVAGLLALMWANPETCLTTRGSGLPVGRRVSAYCIAPPCLTSAELSKLSRNLITSFVYSHDVVSRLSLGSVRDMTRAAWWLCEGKDEESCTSIIKRAFFGVETGFGVFRRKREDEAVLLAMRKTLEANMHMTELYPAGTVYWAIRESDIDPSASISISGASKKLKLFRVLQVEKVFDQIVFARDMLSSHMPNVYDTVLHEML